MSDTPIAPTPEPSSETAAPWIDLALSELRQKRTALEEEIQELERRRAQLQQEITSTFAGQSDAIARRLKGFQDYLVGALQELAVSAEQMELVVQHLPVGIYLRIQPRIYQQFRWVIHFKKNCC